MNRRDFIKLAGSISLLTNTPRGLLAANLAPASYLLLVELNGGNDGLNTVIPFKDPMYKKLRPNLAINPDNIIKVSPSLGLHNSLTSLMPTWQANELAIINGVGYAEPNRSHFRSIEIWDTASDSEEYLYDGWLARAIAGQFNHHNYVTEGIVFGRNTAPLSGNGINAINLKNLKQFIRQSKRITSLQKSTTNDSLAHLLAIQSNLSESAKAIQKKLSGKLVSPGNFPTNPFAKSLKEAASLIVNDAAAPVIKVSLSGFDTHSNQQGKHSTLLKQLAEGLSAFRQSMINAGVWDNVLVMTYSEFGRRAKENASRGTDHGTAAPHFMLGGKVNGGLYGEQPSLNKLDNNDLKYHIDYRQMYNTVINDWWGLSNQQIKNYKSLNCIKV